MVGIGLALTSGQRGLAVISYTTPGSVYSENFDGLPTDAPSNASIESGSYLDGWQDDTTTAPNHVSVPGWYLHHPLSPAAENGFDGNQRFRMGPGANTGSFWGFATASSTNPEKALGSIGSTTVAVDGAKMFMGLRFVNNTGVTLNSVTVTYNGEQWRDGQSPSGETLLFDYSLSATTADWFSTAVFTAVQGLDFTSPVVAGVSNGGTSVNGNVEGLVTDISSTITGISWAPGADLWLRWGDPQLAGNADDGLAIDNVRVSAVPEPGTVSLFAVAAVTLLGYRRLRRPA